MLTHSFWWLAVDALAVYRLAILITKDSITESARDQFRRWGYNDDGTERTHHVHLGSTVPPYPSPLGARRLYTLLTCPWCVSIWLGAAVVALTRFAPSAWQYAALALAFSGVAGFLAER
jgi:Protein of unknown function (DUF1360)